MESELHHTNSPLSYIPTPFSYPTAGAGLTLDPTLAFASAPSPEPTSYTPPGTQQYQPLSQYPSPVPHHHHPETGQTSPREQHYGYEQASQLLDQSTESRQQVADVVDAIRHHQRVPPHDTSYDSNDLYDTYYRYIIFAWCVFWCCNPLFGLIGFVLAG